MMTVGKFSAAAIICGGALILCGCRQQMALPGSVPIPAPHAAPPVQTQIQEINDNSHIPAAQKAIIESHMSSGSGIITDRTPAKAR